MNQLTDLEGKDAQLWRTARRRASFRRQFATYIIVNVFLWAIWFFSDRGSYGTGVPWPLWATLGWGVSIAYSWYGAFGGGVNAIEKEYDRLKRR